MKRRGASLVEIMIVVAIVGILAAIVGGGLGVGCNHKDEAEAQARAWAGAMYPGKQANVVCVKKDSDGDGYVSCTVSVASEAGATPEMVGIECASGWGGNEGCRVPKMKANAN